MRRSYISPEYISKKVYGSFNMVEESNFFLSKMLDIEDKIYISKQDLIYYQNSNGEQLNFAIESSIASLVYSSNEDKLSNHTLIIDESQTQYQRDRNTKWIMTINLSTILKNYLFASMKKFRSFEGLKNNMTRNGDVNVALKNYIDSNVYNRYKFSKIDLYISYKDLRDQSILRYKNYWNQNVDIESNRVVKIQTETATDESTVKLFFNQEKDSSDFAFEYYYNILFEKL
jgi:hypothetical protein